jgi:hypothetical protein
LLHRSWQREPQQVQPFPGGSKKNGISKKVQKLRAAQRKQSKKKKR